MHKKLTNNTLNTNQILKSVKVTLLIMCINFSGIQRANAQQNMFKQPYDGYFYGGMLVFGATDLVLTNRLNSTPHKWEISPIDKLAVHSLKSDIAHAADVTAGATIAASAAITLMMPKSDRYGYMNQLVQSMWMTGNSVQLVKILVQRSRPYTNGTDYKNQGNKDDNYSFFSGHSALTASAATTALLYAFRHNQSNAMKYTSVGAGVFALTTATFRILAGKHYPSDVLTGILFGTGVSLLNWQLRGL